MYRYFDLMNIWFPMLVGYIVVTLSYYLANRSRSEPLEKDMPKLRGIGRLLKPENAFIIALFFAIVVPIRRDVFGLIGLILYILGIVIALFATTEISRNSKGIINSGIFKISRNPIYFGLNLMMLSFAVMAYHHNMAYFVMTVAIVLYVILVHIEILREERGLSKKYKSKYDKYHRESARYFLFF